MIIIKSRSLLSLSTTRHGLQSVVLRTFQIKEDLVGGGVFEPDFFYKKNYFKLFVCFILIILMC
jgi:hypothetical protein